MNDIWKKLFLTPSDYGFEGLNDKNTRKLMECIEFEHGGEKYDSKYPDGIPTSVVITTKGKCLNQFILAHKTRRKDL